MAILLIPLGDSIVDPKHVNNPSSVPMPGAISYIKKAYGFLASVTNGSIHDGIVGIEYPEESEKEVDKPLEDEK